MFSAIWVLAAGASAALVHAATLNDVCTSSYVAASLPADGFYQGITIDASSLLANLVSNASVSNNNMAS